MNALLRVEEAQTRLLALRPPLPSENIPLSHSFGRFTSEDTIALRDQPVAPISAMDGFAIRFLDIPGPWILAGEVAAGAVPAQTLASGEAIRIFTGANLPDGADTVMVQEDTEIRGDTVFLTGEGPASLGRHIRARGSDFAAGDCLLGRGMRLTAGALAAAAMGGTGHILVNACPRVAIVTTGNELVPPGQKLEPGQIPDSNGIMLAAMLAAEPAYITPPCHVRDDRQVLSSVLRELAQRHDVIVTTGGASVGTHDHVQGAIADAGGTIEFWKIAMRPGKPLLAATLGETIIVGLPGNPSSAFVTAALFLLPLIRHLAGAADPLPQIQQAWLATPLEQGGMRRDYLRAVVENGILSVLTSQDSGQTLPLAVANALMVREIGADAMEAGTAVPYIML